MPFGMPPKEAVPVTAPVARFMRTSSEVVPFSDGSTAHA